MTVLVADEDDDGVQHDWHARVLGDQAAAIHLLLLRDQPVSLFSPLHM